MIRCKRGRHVLPELAARRRTRRLALAGALLAVVAAAVPATVHAGTPGSQPGVGQWVGGKVLAPGPEQLVLWKLPGASGVDGTCIDARRAGPLRGPYVRSKVVADPLYGELNHLYGSASTSDVRLAELSALNSHKYDTVDRAVQWSYLVNKQGGLSVADAASMLNTAAGLAGPYVVTIALPDDVRSGPVYTAIVSVRSAANNMVPGATVSLSASNAILRTAVATTDSIGRVHVPFSVPKGASTNYTLSASVQSWTNVAEYTAPGEQTMLTAGPPTIQRSTKAGPIVRDRAVSLVKAAADDPAHAPVAGYTYRISDPAGKVIVPAVVSSTAPVAIGRLTMGTTYTATEIARPANAKLYIPLEATLHFTVPDGSAEWTVLAQDPATPRPALATQVTDERVTVGSTLTDVVTVAGNDAEDGTIDAVLYGPVAPPRSGSCGAITLAQYRAARATPLRVTVSGGVARGNGQVRISSPPVAEAGCYGWAETLTLRPSGATAYSAPTSPHESTLVTPRPSPHTPAPSSPRPTVRPPAPHTPMAGPPASTPPLAQTGAVVPVGPALALGLALIGAGGGLVWSGRRGRRA